MYDACRAHVNPKSKGERQQAKDKAGSVLIEINVQQWSLNFCCCCCYCCRFNLRKKISGKHISLGRNIKARVSVELTEIWHHNAHSCLLISSFEDGPMEKHKSFPFVLMTFGWSWRSFHSEICLTLFISSTLCCWRFFDKSFWTTFQTIFPFLQTSSSIVNINLFLWTSNEFKTRSTLALMTW